MYSVTDQPRAKLVEEIRTATDEEVQDAVGRVHRATRPGAGGRSRTPKIVCGPPNCSPNGRPSWRDHDPGDGASGSTRAAARSHRGGHLQVLTAPRPDLIADEPLAIKAARP